MTATVQRLALLWLVLLVPVGFSTALGIDAAVADEAPELVITGLSVMDEATVKDWIGAPPRSSESREAWGKKAASKLVGKYKRRGYAYVRVWSQFDVETRTVSLHIDEGRMHRIAFRGTNVVSALIYRVDIDLPSDVFHKPTVDKIAEELRRKHGFRNLFFRVRDSPSLEVTPLGEAVPQRELTFFVLSQRESGFGFGLDVDGTWGLIPSARVRGYDLFWEDDQAKARVELGIPYRQYAFEQSPEWQWVYGEVDLAYRSPRLAEFLALRLDCDFSLERHARADLSLDSYVVSRNAGLLSLLGVFDHMELSLGSGLAHSEIFLVSGESEPITDDVAKRWIARSRAAFEFTPQLVRRDQADEIQLQATYGGGLTADTGWLLELSTAVQFVFYTRWFDLLLRQRSFYLGGDVHFWEERNLSGAYLRVFFGRYVPTALQLDAQLRFPLHERNFMGGVWYDYALFGDHGVDTELALGQAHAVGPSLDFVFFDFVALDIYYGFGWDPGFAHNLYLSASTIY